MAAPGTVALLTLELRLGLGRSLAETRPLQQLHPGPGLGRGRPAVTQGKEWPICEHPEFQAVLLARCRSVNLHWSGRRALRVAGSEAAPHEFVAMYGSDPPQRSRRSPCTLVSVQMWQGEPSQQRRVEASPDADVAAASPAAQPRRRMCTRVSLCGSGRSQRQTPGGSCRCSHGAVDRPEGRGAHQLGAVDRNGAAGATRARGGCGRPLRAVLTGAKPSRLSRCRTLGGS